MSKDKKICSKCGSQDVVRDAWAEWDVNTQEWVLQNVFDDGYCLNCETSGNNMIETKEITDE